MSKYVNIDDVLMCIIFQIVGNKDLTCKELREIIEGLPTIDLSDYISRKWVLNEFEKSKETIYSDEYFDELFWLVRHAPSLDKETDKEDFLNSLMDTVYPVGSCYFNHYGLAINPNNEFDNTTWENCGGYWKRVK